MDDSNPYFRANIVAGIIVGILILASAVLTALICFYRVRRRKRITYGTMVAFPFIATFLVMFFAALCIEGLSIFTRDYWTGYRAGPEVVFTIYGLIFAVCFFPALGVAAYNKWRSKRDEKPVA